MKVAQLEQGAKLIKEVVLVLDPWEALQFANALEAFAKTKRKNKRLTQLVDDMSLASMFY